MACDAKIKTADKRTLRCVLDEGHGPPVHRDADGEAWGLDLVPPVEPGADSTNQE